MNINIRLWYNRFQGYIQIKYLILLVLAGLHHDKKITDEKLKGQFKALKAGTLQKYKNTYHCEITDRWYNDESAFEVFQDCVELKGINTISFKNLIKYIQLFENRGYNHALNVFGAEYIYNMFNAWNPEYSSYHNFSDYIDFYIPNIQVTSNSYTCYECGHTHDNFSKNENKNIEVINKWLHNMKKGNLKKIPFFDVKSRNPLIGDWGICK